MIPRRAIDNMKCSLCHNALSIFPINSYGDKDMVICGRCPVQEDFLPQREHLYEELAQHLEFSCRFEESGCIEKMKPVDLKNHESTCPHRQCLCPILPLGSCKWNGNYEELFDHCRDQHPTLTLEEILLEVNLIESIEENHIFRQSDETFILQLQSDSKNNVFHSNVRYVGHANTAKQFSYRVRFLRNKRKFACKVLPVQMGEIGPIITETTTTTEYLDILENLHYPTCVTLSVDIFVKKMAEDQTESEQTETVTAPVENNPVLQILECPVCLEYMVPPILQCKIGHSLCQTCRQQLTTCPTCKGEISDTRNYALENVAGIMSYPCKYRRYGCAFSATGQDITDHQEACQFGPCKCFLENCNWKDIHSKFLDHLNSVHKDNVLETKTVSFVIDRSEDVETYIYVVILNQNIYRIDFLKSEEIFTWTVEQVNDAGISFLLVLDFRNNTGERLFCQKDGSPVSFNIDNLQNFIEDDVLTYSIKIIETE